MDTIFINSKNSKISNPYRLLPNLKDKTNLTLQGLRKGEVGGWWLLGPRLQTFCYHKL